MHVQMALRPEVCTTATAQAQLGPHARITVASCTALKSKYLDFFLLHIDFIFRRNYFGRQNGTSFFAVYKLHRRKIKKNTTSYTTENMIYIFAPTAHFSAPKGTFGCSRTCAKVASANHITGIAANRSSDLISPPPGDTKMVVM